MKRKLLYMIMAALVLAGCSGVLDGISPKHAVTTDSVGEADLVKLTNGVLYTMEGFVSNGWWDGDRMGEVLSNGPGGAALVDVLLMTPSTSDVLSRWQKSMTSLRQVNELLSAATGSSAVAANARKTARFCRAYIYFNMATRWGTAPVIRVVTNEEIPLSPIEDLWTFIISDLNEALAEPSTENSFFYVTDDAINALLAKVYLWMGDGASAASHADKVISSGYSLISDPSEYASTWCYGTSSREIVFALANKRTESQIILYQSVNDTDGSWNYSIPDALFTKLYADSEMKSGDMRKLVVQNDDAPKRILKFPNGMEGQNQFVQNTDPTQSPLVLIRISEMHLVKAEALGNTDDGHKALETFMKSRYTSVELPSSMTDAQWEDLLLDENLREFYGEGHRWFDVKRMNRLDKFATLDSRDYLMRWPVPQHEIDLLVDKSAYPQNPGYVDTVK